MSKGNGGVTGQQGFNSNPFGRTSGVMGAQANGNFSASPFAQTGGLEPNPYQQSFGQSGGGFMANHNRPNSNWMNPTYGQQTQQAGQAAMAPTIANAQTNAQKAIASAGFMTPGPTGASAEWQNKYGNYVKNLTGGYTGPDTGNAGVLSQKGTPLFTMISNGLGAGKSVSEMEGILTGLGYVANPSSPYGWSWGGNGPEPTMAQIYQQSNPAGPSLAPAFSGVNPNEITSR